MSPASARAWGRVVASVLLAAGLAGCGTLWRKAPAPIASEAPEPAKPAARPRPTPPPPPPPVKAGCVPKAFPHPPKYPDTDAALLEAGGAADRYQLMAAGRLLRIRRLAELEKLLEGCR